MRLPPQSDSAGDPANIVAPSISIQEAIAHGDQVLVQRAADSERTGGVMYLHRTLNLGPPSDDANAELIRDSHLLVRALRSLHI